MLEIRNLHAAIDGNEILKGINLTVRKGEIHAIMGPNVRASQRSRKCWPVIRNTKSLRAK
jgi:ABC-type hemin transport system ATPase subunit